MSIGNITRIETDYWEVFNFAHLFQSHGSDTPWFGKQGPPLITRIIVNEGSYSMVYTVRHNSMITKADIIDILNGVKKSNNYVVPDDPSLIYSIGE